MTEQQLKEREIVRNALKNLAVKTASDDSLTRIICLLGHAFARLEDLEDRQTATLQ